MQQDMSDVELVVSGSDKPTGHYGWYNVSQKEFKALTLTCTAYNKSTGTPLNVQPKVFWSKDNVYHGHCERNLVPATLHDSLKSEAEEAIAPGVSERRYNIHNKKHTNQSLFSPVPPTSQGTYWCEAWYGRSQRRLQSNKVLVTLNDTVVFGIKVRTNGVNNYTQDKVKSLIKNALDGKIHYINERVLVAVSMTREALEGSEAMVDQYTFHLHLPVKDLGDEGFSFKRILLETSLSNINTDLPNSSIVLPYYCFKEEKRFNTSYKLKWPATYAGDVHPINHRCRVKYGKLKAGRCVWDFINGAHFTFDSSGCVWSDLCPRGYNMMDRKYCVSVSHTKSNWVKGFNATFKTGSEVTLVDVLRESGSQHRRSKVRRQIHNLVRSQTGSDVVWLPVRRVRKFGPLNHLDPQNFGVLRYDNLSDLNITWGDGQPVGTKDCLTLDLNKLQLLTLDCTDQYPFVSIIKADFLRRPLPPFSSSSSLVINNTLCEPGWQSNQLTENLFCFKLFTPSSEMTWEEAQAFCEGENATLPSPNVGFLDWVYREYLHSNDVSQVWMGARWRPDRVLYNDSVDHLNWLANTKYTKEFGVLRQEGWLLKDGNATHTHVLCQKRMTPTEKLQVEIVKPENEASQTMSIRISPSELLSTKEGSNLQCFINGIYTRPEKSHSNPNNSHLELTFGNQGYYQCFAWSRSPIELVHSNIILHEDRDIYTFVVSLLHTSDDYSPMQHDNTFRMSFSVEESYTTCSDIIMKYLTTDSQMTMFNFQKQNFLYKPRGDSKLLESFHLKGKLKDKSLNITETEVLTTLKDLLTAGAKLKNCSLDHIRSTEGCPSEVTLNSGYNAGNLTWPQTEGKAVVIPEELCVTSEGEAVTRECLGDFVLGYFWTEAKNCTGQPTPVTRQLWHIKNNPQGYLARTNANDTVPTPPLTELTSNSPALQPIDIHLIAQTFQSFTHYNISSLNLDEIVQILNNVMGANSSAFESTQRKLNSSGTLLEAFEELTFKVQLPPEDGDQKEKSSKEHISVERLNLQPNSTIVGYKSSSRKGNQRQRQSLLKKGVTLADLSDAEAAIVLPNDLTFSLSSKSIRKARNRVFVTDSEPQLVPLTFAIYRNDKLFQDNTLTNTSMINTRIIQATFRGQVIKNLRQPVKIYFTPVVKGTGGRCVYWDFGKNEGQGGWSGDGCRKVEEKEEGTTISDHQEVCHCNHLTSFAHLINYNEDDNGFGGPHEAILDTITIIGCCLSILSLLLVFTTFFLFKKWRRSLSNKILVNLSFSVFCSVVIFVAGIDQTWNVKLCRAVAVALHYFILTSFAWMLVEGVHQYLKFVKVVGTYIPRFLWKASVCAWGIPILPVLVLLIYNPSIYDSKDDDDELTICWMSSQGFKIAFLPPLVATMTINLVIFSMIIRGAVCRRPTVNSTVLKRDLFMNQLRMSVCVFFLLGFTWLFGMLAVGNGRLLFSYLFCIFNTLQGFCLFVFHVLRERTARKYWRDFLSILTQEPVSSTPGNSINPANLSGGHLHRDSVTFEKCGGILVLPQGHHPTQLRRTTRTSLLYTAPSSRASLGP
ncbi:hypothetical protein Pcinc_040538 [Petrolisthes cinctipes]|uniref:Uncharacterized protein n=1 Tax=Petrolisthes cinctipes TaxID=88211 RepID=A0AAE1BNZ3_PETCI|nr:hypothetical protein Pcinc_040538 [Petrolisthes cinctipes]